MRSPILFAHTFVVLEDLRELDHHLARLETRHLRRRGGVRQVVERGERRALRQARCRRDDRRVTAHASRRDADDATRLAAELAADDADLGVEYGGEGRSSHLARLPGFPGIHFAGAVACSASPAPTTVRSMDPIQSLSVSFASASTIDGSSSSLAGRSSHVKNSYAVFRLK